MLWLITPYYTQFFSKSQFLAKKAPDHGPLTAKKGLKSAGSSPNGPKEVKTA